MTEEEWNPLDCTRPPEGSERRTEVCPHSHYNGPTRCRCGEGKDCLHEGENPMPCPPNDYGYHCHVEGCTWRGFYGECGQAKLGRTWTLCAFSDLRGTPEWRCGAARNLTSAPNKLLVLTKGPQPRA